MIESVVAAFILVPLALCLLDLGVLVIANSMNDSAAKNAARAGANQSSGDAARRAALNSLETFRSSPIVQSIDLNDLQYDEAGHTFVSCQTKMVVHLPVPFPGLSDITFMAKDVEPILVK